MSDEGTMSEAERDWLARELAQLRGVLELLAERMEKITLLIEELREDLGLPYRQPGD
jgi:hypothetical protein